MLLYIAALLLVLLGAVHSYLGERLILRRLFRREDLPKVLGSAAFTKQTLRFTWHMTTVLLLGLAGVLAVLATSPADTGVRVKMVVAITVLVSAIVSLVGARGRHFSWGVLLLAALLIWIAHV